MDLINALVNLVSKLNISIEAASLLGYVSFFLVLFIDLNIIFSKEKKTLLIFVVS